MKTRIIDYPYRVDESYYHESLSAMTQRLMDTPGVKAVYQVGGISSPGISDLDMVVVFNDDTRVGKNFLAGLKKEERYLFIHNLYGISANNFAGAEQFAFYHHYRLLGGEEVRSHASLNDENLKELKIQIALEYMVRMYITLFLQESYHVLRMRDLLLHIKALQYDLDFLGITSGVVSQHVSQVIEWRKKWFTETPSEKEVIDWWNGFYPGYNQLLAEKLKEYNFFLPPMESYRVAGNILLLPSGGKMGSSQKGFILPGYFAFLRKKYFRLQNKLNRFEFLIPLRSNPIPPILQEKFQFEKKIVEYNRKFLPHFLPVTSSLHAV